MTDPSIAAAADLLDDSLIELRKAVDGCDAGMLNAHPLGEDTNGIAVLATHALYSTRSWLSLATDATLPPRDRPAEFRVVVEDAAAFMTWFDETADGCRALLRTEDPFDAGRTGVPSWRYDETDTGEHEPVSAAWALLHALSHLREHVGHAQLTRQVV